jgi:hypothetical protein
MGYKGFKVNINLLRSVVSKAKVGKTSAKTNLDNTKINNN